MDVSSNEPDRAGERRPALALVSVVALGLGGFGIAFGSVWAPAAFALFASNAFLSFFELLVPFLPIFLLAFGVLLAAKSTESK